jgi:very-short-patch-repair endonuclease/predicted transcriptional regulator of viral defense system
VPERSCHDLFVTRPRLVGVESHVVVADRAAVALARRQHGAITLAQLFEIGHTRAAVRHRVASGWLRRMHRGVYLVGAVEPPLAPAMAAILACGEDALLSHYPAAVLWGLRPPPAHAMHVTVVRRNTRGPRDVHVHRVHHLHPADATRRDSIPVTSPARTLLDLAAHVNQRDLARAVEEARVSRLASDDSLDEQFSRYPTHRGKTALHKVILKEPAFTRSEAERRLLELIRAARLPEPEANARVAGFEVDFLWRRLKLVVEVDGYAFHSTRGAFERDRRRDADLQAAGFRVLRLTWRQIADEPAAVVGLLARATAAVPGLPSRA